MVFQKVIFTVIFLMFSFITIPAFSQSPSDTITIKRVDLERIIADNVNQAVNAAVTAAVKDVESAYEAKITDFKLQLADKDAIIDKKDITINSLIIQKDNLSAMLKAEQDAKLQDYITVGGVFLIVGIGSGMIIEALIVK